MKSRKLSASWHLSGIQTKTKKEVQRRRLLLKKLLKMWEKLILCCLMLTREEDMTVDKIWKAWKEAWEMLTLTKSSKCSLVVVWEGVWVVVVWVVVGSLEVVVLALEEWMVWVVVGFQEEVVVEEEEEEVPVMSATVVEDEAIGRETVLMQGGEEEVVVAVVEAVEVQAAVAVLVTFVVSMDILHVIVIDPVTVVMDIVHPVEVEATAAAEAVAPARTVEVVAVVVALARLIAAAAGAVIERRALREMVPHQKIRIFNLALFNNYKSFEAMSVLFQLK